MDKRLTDQQRAAVTDRGRSLLVSAAAGSGKTKVLVERLFSYVEQERADVDEFLIITYTRAAAAEVRGKIAAALSERMRDDPSDRHLQRQMLRVYRADIKTVDAFCTALLRENCHLLGEDAQHRALRPDFRVLDEQEAAVLKQRVLRRVLERFYAHMDDGARLLADTLGAGRDDRTLEELTLEVYEKLQAQPYREKWLAEQTARWSDVPARIEDTPYGGILLRAMRQKAFHWSILLDRGAAEMQSVDALREKYAPVFLDAAASLRALATACTAGWDACAACEPEFGKLGAVRGDSLLKGRMKRLWDTCKASVKKQRAWFAVSAADAAADLGFMAPAMRALLALVGEFSRAYDTEKRRINAADFSDQEHEAIRLLVGADGAPTELARTVSQRYREIMVDEYQDTNEVQNAIFAAISREGRNLFTVGDVKQSIYRFRLADPRIFLRCYRTYPDAAEAAPGESARLLLSRNFRSREQVLEAANFVFRNILSVEMGELDYGDAEALYPGADYPASPDCGTEFHFLSLPVQHGADRVGSAEAEAGFVADYIARMLRGGFPVRDEQSGALRPVRAEDIVILMRSPRTRLMTFRRALESRDIRCDFEAGDDFFAAMEVAVVFALLQVVDNPRNDVPLISVLRSPLFSFTPDRLALLRANRRDGDFYDALLAGEGEDVSAFLALLRELREKAQTMSVSRLLSEIYDRCGVLAIFGAMPGGAERKENLLTFFSLAERFEASGHRGLFAFVTHLRSLLESGEAAAPASSGSTGGVRIMSIHKSKGLEFPVVILADLARRFSNMDFTGSVLVHPSYGLGPVCVDLSRRIRYASVARDALEYTLRRETKAEELRLLYVAMTRAREKFVLVHTQAGAEKRLGELIALSDCPALPESVDECKCMGEWVMLPLLCRAEAQALRDLAELEVMQLLPPDGHPWHVEVHDALDFAPAAQGAQGAQTCPADARSELPLDTAALDSVYPYALETALPAKLTATQLKGRERDEAIAEEAALTPRPRPIEAPRFLSPERTLTAAERGTAMHLAMQYLDFSAPGDTAALRAQADALAARRLLTEEQAAALDLPALARFWGSALALRIRRSTHVEREYQFSILQAARTYAPAAASDDTVLLQGVVDCFFEEDGELVVVDFKTDRVSPATSAQRAEEYRPQVTAYADALARIWGRPVKEKLLYFFATGEAIVI